jgi:hypothetical protein
LHLKDFNREKSSILVSILHSNYLSTGEAWNYYLRVQIDSSIWFFLLDCQDMSMLVK